MPQNILLALLKYAFLVALNWCHILPKYFADHTEMKFYRFAEYLSGYSNMLLKICTMICQSFRHVVMDLQNMFSSY